MDALVISDASLDGPRIDWKMAALFIASSIMGVSGVVGVIQSVAGYSAQVYQGAGFLLAAIILSIVNIQWLMSWSRHKVGLFLLMHVAVATLSGVLASAPIESTTRYILLLPALSMVLAAEEMGGDYVGSMRAGFTLAAFVPLTYSLFRLDFGRISEAEYRGVDYLNPNTVGFYAAVCGISLFEYAMSSLVRNRVRTVGMLLSALFPIYLWCDLVSFRHMSLRSKAYVFFQLIGVDVCVACILASKSRTAALAFLTGLMVILILKLGFRTFLLIATIGLAVGATIAAGAVAVAAHWVSTVFQFEDRYRGLEGGTGRFEAWGIAIRQVWLPNWLLGVGPGLQSQAGKGFDAAYPGAHNGLLVDLTETGVLGTLPVIGILLICSRNAYFSLRNSRKHLAIAIFIVALVESIGEPMLLNIGNPGSFLVLLSLAMLARDEQEEADDLPAWEMQPAETLGAMS